MRLGYTSVLTKTSSGEAKDVTGPVLTKDEVSDAFETAKKISQVCARTETFAGVACEPRYDDLDNGNQWALGQAVLSDAFRDNGLDGIGIPAGIKARAQRQAGTPTLSIGYWLDAERRWLLEGFVLAAPISVKVYGDGTREDGVTPNFINGKHIATVNLLPPLVVGSYHLLPKTSPVRPYVGVGATYAVFFGAESTAVLNQYTGGPTTVSTKNTFGVGPFAGLQAALSDVWHVNLSVGRLSLRTRNTIVTSNTVIRSGDPVLSDLTPGLSDAIVLGEQLLNEAGVTDATTKIAELAARNKGQANLGTFVRTQDMKITNTIITLSVGRSF